MSYRVSFSKIISKMNTKSVKVSESGYLDSLLDPFYFLQYNKFLNFKTLFRADF